MAIAIAMMGRDMAVTIAIAVTVAVTVTIAVSVVPVSKRRKHGSSHEWSNLARQ